MLRNSLVRCLQCRQIVRSVFTTVTGHEGFPFNHIEKNQSNLKTLLMAFRERSVNDTTNLKKAKEFCEENYYDIRSRHKLRGYAVLLNNSKAYPFVNDDDQEPSDFVHVWTQMLKSLPKKTRIDNNQWKQLEDELKIIDINNLAFLVTSLKELSRESKDFHKLSSLLNEASLRHLEYFNLENTLPHFRLCYKWFDTLAKADWDNDWRQMSVTYPYEFVKKTIDDIEVFASGELFFLLYVSGFYRHFPGTVK